MIFSLFSGFWCLKPSPVELPGRGFDFCGDLLLCSAGCYLHPFESRSPQGRQRARPGADVRYGGDIICRVFGKKCRRRASAVLDSQAGCACLSPGERTQKGETAPGKERAGTRRNVGEAAAKTALPLTARRPFAGVRKAQVTARKRAAHPDKDAASLPLTSDIRH